MVVAPFLGKIAIALLLRPHHTTLIIHKFRKIAKFPMLILSGLMQLGLMQLGLMQLGLMQLGLMQLGLMQLGL
ncbi:MULTISPECIES: hypothetical protein, partial [Spirulina sp. CCY15215]|uniref:hypothetical protein n=1 Tax=Spirulina sp. CCY15215 TaxID=2767591 RepID=UPI00194E6625